MARAAAALVIHPKTKKILAITRNGNEHNLALPGGFVKDEEEFHEGAIRELKEETNLDVDSLEGLHKGDPGDGNECVVFIVKPADIDKAKTNSHEGEVKWIDAVDLLSPYCSFAKFNKEVFKKLWERFI